MSAPVFVDCLFTGMERDRQAARVGSRHGHQWCHMWSEDVEALHAMAARIGMKRQWFQNRKGFPHYDLVPTKRAAALRAGAVEMPLRDYLQVKRLRAPIVCPKCRKSSGIRQSPTTDHPGVFECVDCRHQFCA